jgi:hypothetical protein
MQELLQELIRGFRVDPAASARRVRELLEKDRDAFLPAALASLQQARDSLGYRYLIALLAGSDLLPKCICDPSLSVPAALLVAHIGLELNPALGTELALELVHRLAAEGGDGDEHAIRILEILGRISGGLRLLPLITNLLQHDNPRVRSKVALLIGRRNGCAGWMGQRKGEPDARVRANSIEGLWDAGDGSARRVLWDATCDPHNRVVGNALLGLYRLGDTRAIERILEMAQHPEPLFRASAAWVMGESADVCFLSPLRRMLADKDKIVRARAFRSLSNIRRHCSQSA